MIAKHPGVLFPVTGKILLAVGGLAISFDPDRHALAKFVISAVSGSRKNSELTSPMATARRGAKACSM
jgi:hypothetical protein